MIRRLTPLLILPLLLIPLHASAHQDPPSYNRITLNESAQREIDNDLLVAVLFAQAEGRDAATPSAGRQIIGAVLACVGISLLALWGFGGGPAPWVDIAAFAFVIGGAFLSGLIYAGKSR